MIEMELDVALSMTSEYAVSPDWEGMFKSIGGVEVSLTRLAPGEIPEMIDGHYGVLVTEDASFVKQLSVNKDDARYLLIYVGDPEDLGDDLAKADEVWAPGKSEKTYITLLTKSIRRMRSSYIGSFYQDAFMSSLDQIPEVVWVKDPDGTLSYVNQTFAKLAGKTKEELVGSVDMDAWPISEDDKMSDRFGYHKTDREVIESGTVLNVDEIIRTVDGEKRFSTNKMPLINPFGKTCGTVGIARDISDFANAGAEISILIENLPLPLVITDADFDIIKMNASFKALTRLNEEQLREFDYPTWKVDNLIPATTQVKNKKTHSVRQDFRMRDGFITRYFAVIEQEILDHMENVSGYYCLFLDMTSQKMYEKAILQEANSDSLTGLFNRKYFYDYIKSKWGTPMTLLYMDLDHFKEVNDTYGHSRGDEVIRETANLIAEIFEEGIAARIGGDEFTVLIHGKSDDADLDERCKRLEVGIQNLFRRGSIPIGVSIGRVYTDGQTEEVDEFVGRADGLMYEAKVARKAREQAHIEKTGERPVNRGRRKTDRMD
ncbi:MAG: diguanylate cyclase [Eubacterium sp.]|nr:diguanylate cyclase [Eubacterium sp.]